MNVSRKREERSTNKFRKIGHTTKRRTTKIGGNVSSNDPNMLSFCLNHSRRVAKRAGKMAETRTLQYICATGAMQLAKRSIHNPKPKANNYKMA